MLLQNEGWNIRLNLLSVELEAAGSWIFFCVIKVCGHIIKRLYRVGGGSFFCERLQQHGHEFRDETQLLAKETV